MSLGDSKDWNEFNCNQEHELNYVLGLYKLQDRSAITQWIKNACKSNELNHTKYIVLYSKLEKAGFKKK